MSIPKEAIAQRKEALAKARALTTKVREDIKAAGPGGVRAGEFVMGMVLAGESMSAVLDALKALEVIGLIRLEGVRTVVSEEIEDSHRPVADVTEPTQPTLTEGRNDRGWPKPPQVQNDQ